MEKRLEHEGNPSAKILQLMAEVGYSKPVNIEVATVVSAPPALRVQLDADGLVLEADDLIVAERLTRHKRTITFKAAANMRFGSTTASGETTPAGDPTHTHSIVKATLNDVQNDFAIDQAVIEYEDELKAGDRVLLACLDEDMVYIVLDRAVWYA